MRHRCAPPSWAPLTASRAFGLSQGKSGRVLSNIPFMQTLCLRGMAQRVRKALHDEIKFIDARFADPDVREFALKRRFE